MENLKLLRKEKTISQSKLAKEIKTSQQNICRYENGLYEPDIQTLKLLANYFETSIDYLVGNTNIRHKIEYIEPFDLNDDEVLLINKYRQLKVKARGSIMNIVDILLDHQNN